MNISQKSFSGKILKTITEFNLFNKGDVVVVGTSGGPDSIALLSSLLELKDHLELKIKACHYNHRLRGNESERDQEFVENFCKEKGIELILGRAKKENLFKNEEEARDARYQFFKKILKEGNAGKIALAHQLNDSVETFLMRLIRGSGFAGLRGIPLVRDEEIVRPLLFSSRDEIIAYLKERGLEYVTDSSNLFPIYTRNRIRHSLVPLLLEFNPNIFETLSNTIRVMESDYDLLVRLAEGEYSRLATRQGNKINFERKKYLKLHPSLRLMVLRMAISEVSSLKNITSKQLFEVESMIQKGEGKKHKSLPSSLKIGLENGKIVIFRELTIKRV